MRKIVGIILGISLCTSVFGQNQDAIAWTGIGVNLPITKKFELKAESQIRLDNNMSRLQNVYGEIGGGYRIIKGLKAGAVYRYARKNSGDYFWNENRLSTWLSYRYKFNFGLNVRLKTRHQFAFDRFGEVNGIEPLRKHVWRTSLKMSFKSDDLKIVSPFVSGEIFHGLSPKNETGDWLDTYRLRVGLDFDLPDRHSLMVFYMYEHENRSIDNNLHIYCLQWNYEIKSLWKWKSVKAKRKAD